MREIARAQVAADKPRYTIAEFKGESEFQHSNQVIFEEDGRQRSPSKDDVSSASSNYLLVADRLSGELYLYNQIPLWRLDTGGVDERIESQWHQTATKITHVNSLGLNNQNAVKGQMWSAMSKAIFVDLLQLAPNSPIVDQVAQIEKQVHLVDFGESDSQTSGTLLLQRIVQPDGNAIVINNSVSGQLLTALSAERNLKTPTEVQCKSIVYMADKPMETLSGVLTLRTSDELPDSIVKMIDLSTRPESTRDQVREVLPSEPTEIAERDPNAAAIDESARYQNNRNIVMLVIGSLAVFLVLVFRSFHNPKEKSDE